MKSLLTLAGIFAAAVSFAAVQVSEMPGAVFLKNDHLEAVVTAKGGKLASLRDVAAKMEYGHGYSLQALKAGKLGPADGFAKSRVWETTSDRTLFTSDFDLRVVRKTDKEVVVEASYRAMSGLIKGVDVIHRYTLRDGESRIHFRQFFNSDASNATFSPWNHNAPQFPDSVAEKNTVRLFAQSRKGAISTPVQKTPSVHNMIADPQEGWLGFAGANKNGFAMVTDLDKISHMYCWLGSEYFCTSEVIYRQVRLADGGSVNNQVWYIPARGLDNYRLGCEDYMAGIENGALKFFMAVPAGKFTVKYTFEGKTAEKSFANLKAGDCVSIPLPRWDGSKPIKVNTELDSQKREHDVKLIADRNAGDVLPLPLFQIKAAVKGVSMISPVKKLYLSNQIVNSVHFGLRASFPKKKVLPTELYLEVPAEVKLYNPSFKPLTVTKVIRNGKELTQYKFKIKRGSYYAVINMFMDTTLPAGGKSEIYYYAKSPVGNQKVQTLPVESVDFRPVKRVPKRLVAGLGFYGMDAAERWPNHFDTITKCGMNVVSLSFWDIKPDNFRNYVQEAKKRNLYVTGNSAPSHRMEAALQKEVDARVMNLEGKRELMVCPSYRGPAFVAERTKIARQAEAGVAIHYWDTENWTRREYCFCDRCINLFEQYCKKNLPQVKYVSPRVFELTPARYPELHKAWFQFRLAIGTEFFLELTKECQKQLDRSGVTGMVPPGEKMIVGLYNVTPGKIYHHFMRYDELAAAGAANITMPSYYYGGDAYRTGASVRNIRKTMNNSRIIPWICGGAGAEYETDAINHKYILMEIFFNGCMGFTTWPWMGWDALDLKYLTEVMNMAIPLENIIVDGKVDSEVVADDKHVRVAALRLNDEMTVLLSDYYHKNLQGCTLTISVPRACGLFDVASRKKVADLKAGVNKVKIPAYKDNARLFYAGEKAPETDFVID